MKQLDTLEDDSCQRINIMIVLYRPETIFDATYRDLYTTCREELSSDSLKRQTPKWHSRLQIIDSTTITLFSNLIFKSVGRHPKTSKKKGGIKVICQHTRQ